MNRFKSLLCTLMVMGLSFSMSGQGFLKKLTDKTMDKIQQKAEDKLVDELSEKLANQAVKPINTYMDSLFADSYEEQTGEKYDPANTEKINAFLGEMFKPVALPESYDFEYTMEIEVKDFGEKKAKKMNLYVSTEQSIFAMDQSTEDEKVILLMDADSSLMATYNLDTKEVMAFSMNSSFMDAMYSYASQQNPDLVNVDIKKTGKTKKILDYNSEEYEYIMEDQKSKVYVSKELPFNWEDSFGNIMKQFAPHFYQENDIYKMDGMMLEANTKRDSDGKKSEWKTKKVSSKSFKIDNSKFKQVTPTMDN